MLTVKQLFEAMRGLDPNAQVVVGLINGPRFSAAYAQQQLCATADADRDQRVTLRDAAAPALYLCCYEQPRPWEGRKPTVNNDGSATLRHDPDHPTPGKEG